MSDTTKSPKDSRGKLLFLIYSMQGGGAERVTALLANHWAAEGRHVTIATLARFELDFYSLSPLVRRVELNLAASDTTAFARIFNTGLRLRGLRAFLRAERPALSIAMMSTMAIDLAIAATGLRLRTLGAERTHPPSGPEQSPWERLRPYAYPRLTAVVAQTHRTALWLTKSAPGSNITIIPNPVLLDLAEVSPLPTNSPSNVRTLLGVGRLVPHKRFDRLVSCFARARELARDDWELIIVGEGPDRIVLEKQIRRLNVLDKVTMPGLATDVRPYYAAADLFALTSDVEGFPNVLLEAMAAGRAVVATNCPAGPSEIISDGQNGILVPLGSDDAMVIALVRLMNDPAERVRLGELARQTAIEYSIEAIADRWLIAGGLEVAASS